MLLKNIAKDGVGAVHTLLESGSLPIIEAPPPDLALFILNRHEDMVPDVVPLHAKQHNHQNNLIKDIKHCKAECSRLGEHLQKDTKKKISTTVQPWPS